MKEAYVLCQIHGALARVGEKATVRILDQQGKRVAEAAQGMGEIDFHGHPSGVYRVLVSGDGSMGSFKQVVP